MVIGSGIEIGSGIRLTPSNSPLTGTAVPWTNNSYFNSGLSTNGVTTTTIVTPAGNGAVQSWQLFYAWRSVALSNSAFPTQPSPNFWGFNSYTNETTLVTAVAAAANETNSLNFSNSTAATITYTTTNITATAGGFNQNDAALPSGVWVLNGGPIIPAETYFLIGMFWPRSRTYQTMPQNRTAFIGSTPYVTACNTVYWGNPNFPVGAIPAAQTPFSNSIPTQLGGIGQGYIEYPNTTMMMSQVFLIS